MKFMGVTKKGDAAEGKTAAAKKSAAVKTAAARTTTKKATPAEKADAAKTAAKTAAKKTASSETTAAAKTGTKTAAKTSTKKTVAGIDENGTFRAWDNAKTVAKKSVKKEVKDSFVPGTTAEQAAKKLAAAQAADPNNNVVKKNVAYTDDQIKHLDPLEHIRLRPGMYIGRLGNGSNQNDGIYVLLKEIIDNSIDEFIMGNGTRIDVEIKENRVKVRDFGRGIPLNSVVECVSVINTGGKYDDDVFQFSIGMNGVGTKAVNALSSYFRVVSIRDGECTEVIFEKGKLISNKKGKMKAPQPNGTYFEFVPDVEIFGEYSFNMEFVEKRMKNYSYLNTGLTLRLNGQNFVSTDGLLDLLKSELDSETLYEIGSYSGPHLQFAFSHTNAYGANYYSFVNGQFTSDGGTHLSAFREGFVKGINEFYHESYKTEDICEGMTAAILAKVKDPLFESQTKNKLGNTNVRSWIVTETQSALDDWLHKHPKAAERIQAKIEHNEKMRTELASVKKQMKEAAKKISIRIPKLDDCRFHLEDGAKGDGSMIFITEGESAAGVMTHSRNADTQAIFRLRGKPENMYGKKQTDIYKNDELHQLMCALGIDESVENLKYSKIVIATDADNDGFHIRNLLLTFFLGYFEELITQGRVFILETPLFRVRTKKENIYCYSESERDAAQEKLGKSSETSRFKGLGEINPSEFKQFIAPDTIRLTPVEVSQLKIIPQLLAFYMGKNTPERRSFIEQNLLSNSEIDA